MKTGAMAASQFRNSRAEVKRGRKEGGRENRPGETNVRIQFLQLGNSKVHAPVDSLLTKEDTIVLYAVRLLSLMPF